MAWEGMQDKIVYQTIQEYEDKYAQDHPGQSIDVVGEMQMAHGYATELSGTSLGVNDTNPDLHRSIEGDEVQLAVFGKNSYRIQEIEVPYEDQEIP